MNLDSLKGRENLMMNNNEEKLLKSTNVFHIFAIHPKNKLKTTNYVTLISINALLRMITLSM